MKRKVAILLLSFLALVGCSKKIEPFKLDKEYYGTAEFKDVPASVIKELEKDKANFLVFVYMASCTSCANFDRVLEDFLEDYPMTIYKVSLLNITGTKMEENVRYSPSVVIYKEGEVLTYLNAISDDDMPYYESSEGFKEWLSKYVILKSN